MSEPLRDTITEDLADGNGDLAAPCSVHDVADLFDTIDRLTAERDAAQAEATRLREALAASLDHCKTWHGDCCPCDRGPGGDDFCTEGATVDEIVAAFTPPTDQGEASR